mgnify:CR=1 FL=1
MRDTKQTEAEQLLKIILRILALKDLERETQEETQREHRSKNTQVFYLREKFHYETCHSFHYLDPIFFPSVVLTSKDSHPSGGSHSPSPLMISSLTS